MEMTIAAIQDALKIIDEKLPDLCCRVYKALVRAEDVLGTKEKAQRWLKSPIRALGGVTPLSLLDTDAGAEQVDIILGRIEYGVYS